MTSQVYVSLCERHKYQRSMEILVTSSIIPFLKILYPHMGPGAKREGARGARFPGRQFTMRTLNHCGNAELLREPPKSPKNVTSTFLSTENLLSKGRRFHHCRPNFDHGGAGSTTGAPNLFLAPGAI